MELALHAWGAGDRRILLLHGISSNGAGWWRLGADLAALGWSVTAPDLRGHGRSPKPGSYAFSAYAADLVELGSGWDAVVGHSMGGTVAVLAHHLDPGWTRHLVLQDPALLLVEHSRDDAVEWLLEPFDRPLTAEAVAADNPGWHPEDCRIKAEALRECGAETVRRTVADNRPWNVLEETQRLAVPTSLIASDPECGGITPITIGEWLAIENPQIDFTVVEGAGHSAHREVDHYDTFFAELIAALDTDRPREQT